MESADCSAVRHGLDPDVDRVEPALRDREKGLLDAEFPRDRVQDRQDLGVVLDCGVETGARGTQIASGLFESALVRRVGRDSGKKREDDDGGKNPRKFFHSKHRCDTPTFFLACDGRPAAWSVLCYQTRLLRAKSRSTATP
jgi:hypothetical protein